MDTTRAILYPTPPPTSNNLDAHQRARLVRSTRKLGALLGTTPHLLESDSEADFPPTTVTYRPDTPQSVYHTKKTRRHASVFSVFPESLGSHSSSSSSCSSTSTHSSNTSVTSFTLDSEPRSSLDSTHSLPTPASFSSKARRSADAIRPRPLVLRLNAVPVAPSDPRLPTSPILLPSPDPNSNSNSATPCTPLTARRPGFGVQSYEDDGSKTPMTPVFPTQSEVRRKKMAKLTRTLGENIPPELVFVQSQSQPLPPMPTKPTRSSRRRQASVNENVRGERPPSQIWVTGTSVWRGEWNRKDIRDVQQGLRNLRIR